MSALIALAAVGSMLSLALFYAWVDDRRRNAEWLSIDEHAEFVEHLRTREGNAVLR